jgi:hypothetical protein
MSMGYSGGTIFLISLSVLVLFTVEHSGRLKNAVRLEESEDDSVSLSAYLIVPDELLDLGVYSESDFINKRGIQPTFWDCEDGRCSTRQEWGPCYAPRENLNWIEEVDKYNATQSPEYMRNTQGSRTDLAGLCRPGFLIIGAGKQCSEMSLILFVLASNHRLFLYQENLVPGKEDSYTASSTVLFDTNRNISPCSYSLQFIVSLPRRPP